MVLDPSEYSTLINLIEEARPWWKKEYSSSAQRLKLLREKEEFQALIHKEVFRLLKKETSD